MKSDTKRKHINLIICYCLIMYILGEYFFTLGPNGKYLNIVYFIFYPLLYPLLLFTIGSMVNETNDLKKILVALKNVSILGLFTNIVKFLAMLVLYHYINYTFIIEVNIFLLISISIL